MLLIWKFNLKRIKKYQVYV